MHALSPDHGILPDTHRHSQPPPKVLTLVLHQPCIPENRFTWLLAASPTLQSATRITDIDDRMAWSSLCQAHFGPGDRIPACNQPRLADTRPSPPTSASIGTWYFAEDDLGRQAKRCIWHKSEWTLSQLGAQPSGKGAPTTSAIFHKAPITHVTGSCYPPSSRALLHQPPALMHFFLGPCFP